MGSTRRAFLPYGVRFPNQMKLAPLPSVTVIVQPKPVAHAGPLVGNVWCQPDWSASQTVYVPAGRPGNRNLPEASDVAVALTGPLTVTHQPWRPGQADASTTTWPSIDTVPTA